MNSGFRANAVTLDRLITHPNTFDPFNMGLIIARIIIIYYRYIQYVMDGMKCISLRLN